MTMKSKYKEDLLSRFWDYRNANFDEHEKLFDKQVDSEHSRPPVFVKKHLYRNVLVSGRDLDIEVCKTISPEQRHRWFGSMKSSQALAQSVFGNLKYHNKLHVLEDLLGDDGKPLFIYKDIPDCKLEYKLDNVSKQGDKKCNILGEEMGRSTSIDVFFPANFQVAVECKMTEEKIGECSKFEHDKDCYLTRKGIHYWNYIPKLFNWTIPSTCNECEFRKTYQLVRNILAVCVQPTGELSYDTGHAVMLYDERNPKFQDDKDAMNAWIKTKNALKYPNLLQQCTWQQLTQALRKDQDLVWLTDGMMEKYGL